MSAEDLWWLFLNHREECSQEFWEELETRKDAGTLSKDSPFWAMGTLARYRHPRGVGSTETPENVSTDFNLMVISSFVLFSPRPALRANL